MWSSSPVAPDVVVFGSLFGRRATSRPRRNSGSSSSYETFVEVIEVHGRGAGRSDWPSHWRSGGPTRWRSSERLGLRLVFGKVQSSKPKGWLGWDQGGPNCFADRKSTCGAKPAEGSHHQQRNVFSVNDLSLPVAAPKLRSAPGGRCKWATIRDRRLSRFVNTRLDGPGLAGGMQGNHSTPAHRQGCRFVASVYST